MAPGYYVAEHNEIITGIIRQGPGGVDFILCHSRGSWVTFTISGAGGFEIPHSSTNPNEVIVASRHHIARDVLSAKLLEEMHDLSNYILEIQVNSVSKCILHHFRAYYSLRSHRGYILQEYAMKGG